MASTINIVNPLPIPLVGGGPRPQLQLAALNPLDVIQQWVFQPVGFPGIMFNIFYPPLGQFVVANGDEVVFGPQPFIWFRVPAGPPGNALIASLVNNIFFAFWQPDVPANPGNLILGPAGANLNINP